MAISSTSFKKGNTIGRRFEKGHKIGHRFPKGHKGFREKGYCISDVTKRKISETRKKIGLTFPYRKGFKLSDEQKKKISERSKGNKYRLGKIPWNKDKGVAVLRKRIQGRLEYLTWREAVFAKDNWTCQKCWQRGGNKNAHHIISFFEIIKRYKIKTTEDAINCQELWNINNGLTLCEDCHRKIKHTRLNLSLI